MGPTLTLLRYKMIASVPNISHSSSLPFLFFTPIHSMGSAPKKRLQSLHGSQSSFSSSTSSSSSGSSPFRSNSFPCNRVGSTAPPSPYPSFHISKVPFSWEQHPGIPKESNHKCKNADNASLAMLPLPPSSAPTPLRRFSLETIWKKTIHGSLERDPFAAALMECSKDGDDQQDDEKYWKVSRMVSNRFGFLDRYGSCKKSCAVAESVILLPRSIRKP